MLPEMETALYYTFSTIAQAVTAALGLLAVFLALRINAFNRVIYDRMQEMMARSRRAANRELLEHYWRGDSQAFFAGVRRELEGVKAEANTGNAPKQTLDQDDEVLLTQADVLLTSKACLVAKARNVVLGSAGVIVFSIIVLAIVPWARGRAMLCVALLAAGVVWTGACILSYVQVIRKALREA